MTCLSFLAHLTQRVGLVFVITWCLMVVGWWFMVFNATFNNISVISWRSGLLVEESGAPGENHRPVAGH
jgi:predicted tellurium resistance membrane protein TerC